MRSFNPRPLAGDDTKYDQASGEILPVSIHVPLRGTTPFSRSGSEHQNQVSIHVPLRGTTPSSISYNSFQLPVSIHVPLRGTTPQFCPIISKIYFKNTYISHISPYHYTVFPFLSPPFQPILCNFSGANPPEFLCLLHIRTQMPLHNKNPIRGSSSVNSHMFYFCFILISQIIKP